MALDCRNREWKQHALNERKSLRGEWRCTKSTPPQHIKRLKGSHKTIVTRKFLFSSLWFYLKKQSQNEPRYSYHCIKSIKTITKKFSRSVKRVAFTLSSVSPCSRSSTWTSRPKSPNSNLIVRVKRSWTSRTGWTNCRSHQRGLMVTEKKQSPGMSRRKRRGSHMNHWN